MCQFFELYHFVSYLCLFVHYSPDDVSRSPEFKSIKNKYNLTDKDDGEFWFIFSTLCNLPLLIQIKTTEL